MGIIQDTFGDGGSLSQILPGYQEREGQVQLSSRILTAMDQGENLIAEAPTGTGKSLAYCLPAVHQATGDGRRRAVIVTANIALQEQLAKKDLPLLQKAFPTPFVFQMLKGVGNYLCHDMMDETRSTPALYWDDPRDAEQWNAITTWSAMTATGDISELPFELRPRVRERCVTSSEDCLGTGCAFRDECHMLRARRAAGAADLVVTNYHLFFADLSIKAGGANGVLPPYQNVVFDEGHKVADIVRDFFGWRVSRRGVAIATGPLKGGRRGKKGVDPELHSRVSYEADVFFGRLAQHYHSDSYKVRIRERGEVDGEQLAQALISAAEELNAASRGVPADRRVELQSAAGRCESAAGHLRSASDLADEEAAYFLDEVRDRVAIAMKPVDVAPILATHVFESDDIRSVTVTSATLSTGGESGFDYVARQLGAGEAGDIEVRSPFDFSRVMLIIPRGVSVPNAKRFADDVGETLVDTVRMARGRTLGLFTSYRVMKVAAERLRAEGLPYRVLVQGEGSRQQLVKEFREDVPSVLLGVESFWQGLDCPGETLSCVFIDKLPFAVPDDPVLSVYEEREGPRFWKRHSLPRAVIAFKQGFGRIIRTVDDVGVVVCCDRRIAEKPYGRAFTKALPDGVVMSRRLEDVTRVL